MKDKSISHISKEPDSLISPFFDFLEKKSKKVGIFRKKFLKNRKKAKSKNPVLTYVRNQFIFHLQVVPSKNIEN